MMQTEQIRNHLLEGKSIVPAAKIDELRKVDLQIVRAVVDFCNGDTGEKIARSETRKVLLAATEDLPSLGKWLKHYEEQNPNGIPVIYRSFLQKRIEGVWAASFRLEREASFRDALAYVAALLISDHERCRTDLRCCKLEACKKFFFVERGKPGRPRDLFCTAEHLKIWHEKDTLRRRAAAIRARGK